MTVLSPVRRIGLSVVAIAASTALLAGCGSSTAGKPLGLGSAVNSFSVSTAANSGGVAPGGSSDAPDPTSSEPAPSVSVGASSSEDNGNSSGTANAEFCTQLRNLGSDIGGSLGDPSGAKTIADKFQKLADSAPAEIKPDLQKMADYLKSVSSGKLPDASATEDYTASAQKVIKYLSTACI